MGYRPVALSDGRGGIGDPEKGAGLRGSGASQILQSAPGARLVVIGAGTNAYAARVRPTIQKMGLADKVVWAGVRHDVQQVWSAIDLLVHPALEEPLGRVLLEAMAAGLPVVASDSTGIRECVVYGVTGLLVRPADGQALTEAIIPFLTDPSRRQRFSKAGRLRVEEHFSASALTEPNEAALRHAITQSKAA